MSENTLYRYKTTVSEKVSYAFYFFGQNLIFTLVSQFLPLYYTDYILLDPFIASIIFFISKIWDSVNDPLFGIIVDKAPLKSGRFVPWIRISTFFIPLVTFMLFCISAEQGMLFRAIWSFGIYLLWDLAYTVCDVPLFALSTAMTDVTKERSLLITIGRFASVFAFGGINLVFSSVLEEHGFFYPVMIAMFVSFFFMLPLCVTAKERFVPEPAAKKEKSSLNEVFIYLRKNKFLLMFFLSYICTNATLLTLGNYIAIYCLGDIKYVGIATIVNIAPALIPFAMVPFLLKRWDKITIYKVATIGTLFSCVISYFCGYTNIPLYMTMTAVRTFVSSFTGILAFTFSGDCVEYGEYKSGLRKEGITFSVQSFTAKLAGALTGSLTLLILGWIRYDGALAVQSAFTVKWLWILNNMIPALGCLLAIPLLMAYKLKDKDVQIMTDYNAGKISREEADALLSRKY